NPTKGTFTALGSANPVTYTITVSNAAKTSGGAFTSPAAGVFLTLDVPASFTKVSTSGTGWDCSTFPVCNYTQNLGTFSSSGSPGSTTLTVTGYYNDDPTLNLAASQGFLAGQAPVMFGATAGSTDNSAVQDSGNPFVEQKVETDIQRLVSVNVSTITPSVTTTPLNSTVSYDVKVANAAGMNQATQLKVNVQLPSNFINGALDAGNSTAGWTCGTFTAGSTVTCTQSSALAGGTTFDLVFTGQYDDASTNLTNSNMPGQGTATVTATPLVTQAVEKNLTDLAPVSQGITLERLVHLSVAQSNGLLGNPTNLANSVTNQILVSNAATTTVNAQQVATNSAVAVKVSWGIDPTAQTVFNVNPTATNTNSPGWTCTYPTGSATTVSPVVCTYSATIASGASAAPLNIIGQYSDLITDTHITGGMAAVAAVATLDLQNADFDPSFTATWNTSTNIQRSVQLSIQQQTATMEPVSLGTQIGYAVAVGNAGGLNTADSIAVTFNLPSGFTYANKFSSPNGDWTNCVLNGSALTCTLDSLQSGRTSDAVTIFGSYSTGLNLSMAGQTQLTVAGNLATSASLDSGSPTVKAFSVTSTVQRAVDLTAAAIPAPGVVGGAAVLGAAGGDPAANTVTYTVTVKNTSGLDASGGSTADPNAVEMTFAVDAVNGDPTVLGSLAPHFKTTSVLVSGNTVAVTCDSITKPGQVFCNYQNQPANSTTTFTISGQFDGSVVLTGSALANAAAKVVSTDSYDVSLTNNSGTTQVAVVDTPASGITNQHPTVLYTTTAPLSLRYDSVTTAGITTLAMSNTAPANFVQPSNSPVDYTSVVAPYFSAATDATYPVAANGLVTACVNINPAGFANPERVRIFDQKGTDITNALALSGTPAVCGATPVAALAPGSPLGFTVREPVLHKPTAQMVTPTQVLTGGSHGGTSNLFTISAGGTVDPDFGQICNGTPSGSGAAQFCGDTLTYVFKGPVGMGINQAGSWSPDFSTLTVVVPAVNGAQGTPPSFTGTFPVGVSAVNLTVTDQTGQSSSASVNVALNSFTLGGSSVTSATILAGQSTSFTFSPTVLINGIQLPASFGGDMTLTCDGSRDSDHSSLAANHMACTMSPSTITQGQSSQVLITTTGPNFSRLRPAAPGSQSRELVAVLAITLFPAFGFVLLPKRRSRKGLLLLILLIAAMAIFMVGCGGGATVQPPAQNIQAQTPAGTYTITVTGTATGGVVSTSTFTVTVH
ncbi:MAG TPA: hypothetical protein VFU76_15350, partial [Terriglobales bacterium]|nr:hypothetical protein [Terriglobales bacterium]